MGGPGEIRELRGPTTSYVLWLFGAGIALTGVLSIGLSPYLLIVGVGAWVLFRAVRRHERRTGVWVNDDELLVGNGDEFVEQLPLSGLTVAIGYERSQWTHGESTLHAERVEDSSAVLYVKTPPPEQRLVRINSAAGMIPKHMRALRDAIQAEIDRVDDGRL